MGVGTPANILEAVRRGVDLFDCVMPSRNARHGHAFTWEGCRNLLNAKYELDEAPLDENCQCPVCQKFSRAYIHHLFKAGEKDREEYARAFAQLPDYCCLVFVYDLIPYKGDARTKLAAAIKQNGTVVNFARQDQGDLVDWVRRRFRALGKEIDTRLACDLIFLCGDLMTNLIGEIEKIGAYAKGGRITREDIDAVATPQLDTVVFRMTDAIGAGKFDQAAQVLGELYQMQEPPIKIMWSLGRNMRQLYSARLALEQGKGPSYVADLWGLRSFQAEKILTAARRFSLPWCRRAVVRCGEVDLAMKSTGQDGQQLLTGLLLELSAPVRKPAPSRR